MIRTEVVEIDVKDVKDTDFSNINLGEPKELSLPLFNFFGHSKGRAIIRLVKPDVSACFSIRDGTLKNSHKNSPSHEFYTITISDSDLEALVSLERSVFDSIFKRRNELFTADQLTKITTREYFDEMCKHSDDNSLKCVVRLEKKRCIPRLKNRDASLCDVKSRYQVCPPDVRLNIHPLDTAVLGLGNVILSNSSSEQYIRVSYVIRSMTLDMEEDVVNRVKHEFVHPDERNVKRPREA